MNLGEGRSGGRSRRATRTKTLSSMAGATLMSVFDATLIRLGRSSSPRSISAQNER
jgi:hypothetical protein